jgi:putative glutamine amidotransferase
MPQSPLVAIPAFRLAAGRVLGWERGAYALPEKYVAPLQRAGAHPVLLPTVLPVEPDEVLSPFSALLLTGGGDVEPARYGAHPHPDVYGVDRVRDEAETALVRAAMDRGLPVFAICRGLQLLNVAQGGTLHQHLADVPGMHQHGRPVVGESVVHHVKTAPGSRLGRACSCEVLRCTSHHHQGIDRLGRELTAVAWSEDGLIEAVEAAGGGPWVVGVQWHPEMTAGEDPRQQALFDAFVAEARSTSTAASSASSSSSSSSSFWST